MSAIEVLMLVVAMLGVVGIAVGMTRWSVGKYAEFRRVASASDKAMRSAATTLGLRFIALKSYEHPMVGTIPAFGEVRGELDGISVVACVVVESEPGCARTELRATLPATAAGLERRPSKDELSNDRYRLERDGTTLTLHPVARRTGSSQFILYSVVTEPALLVELCRALVTHARD